MGVIIKSPRYYGGDFMFLYWFVRRSRIIFGMIVGPDL